MKKVILIVSVVFFFVFSAANAQDTDSGLSIFNIAHLFSWTDTKDDVYEILKVFPELSISESDEGTSWTKIRTESENEDGRGIYSFYFNSQSKKLLQVDALWIMYEDMSASEIRDIISMLYGMDKAENYENSELENIGESFDVYQVTAGPKTACMLGANEPTDERYGMIGATFIDREYLEED